MAYPGPSERWQWRGSELHKGPSALGAPVGNAPTSATNLAFPLLPPGAEKTWGSVGGGGVCSHHCSWEPTFPGYLPDLVSPNTQFIFFSCAASFLFSAAFRGQGSPGSPQRLAWGRNSFETWLFTLVPRMGQMRDPVSGGQLREKQSHTLLSHPRGCTNSQPIRVPLPRPRGPLCERFRFLNARGNTSPRARQPLGKELEPRDLGGAGKDPDYTRQKQFALPSLGPRRSVGAASLARWSANLRSAASPTQGINEVCRVY